MKKTGEMIKVLVEEVASLEKEISRCSSKLRRYHWCSTGASACKVYKSIEIYIIRGYKEKRTYYIKQIGKNQMRV